MSKNFLKGLYYKPENNNEDPYYILKNASKNNLNFIIIEYPNTNLFSNVQIDKKNFLKLMYIQEKIELFEKKYRNIVCILCFKCRSIIGPLRILLSKTIFRNEVLKLNNFHLWCYVNEPILILSKTNYPHVRNTNIKKYFSLFSDNFSKSTNEFINILDNNFNVTPIQTDKGYIYIKNIYENNFFNFFKLKQFIISQIKNGNFYTSNSDNLYLNLKVGIIKNILNVNFKIQSSYLINQKFSVLSNQNTILKSQDFYNLKNVSYNFNIKNNANKFLVFKIISKNNLFALTSPIYIK